MTEGEEDLRRWLVDLGMGGAEQQTAGSDERSAELDLAIQWSSNERSALTLVRSAAA